MRKVVEKFQVLLYQLWLQKRCMKHSLQALWKFDWRWTAAAILMGFHIGIVLGLISGLGVYLIIGNAEAALSIISSTG